MSEGIIIKKLILIFFADNRYTVIGGGSAESVANGALIFRR